MLSILNSKADCTDEWVVLVKSMGKSTFSSVQSAWLYNELIYNATRHYYRNLCIKKSHHSIFVYVL